MWKQLVVVGSDPTERGSGARMDTVVAIALAVVAGAFVKVPALFGLDLDGDTSFYTRNAGLFVLPLLYVRFLTGRGPFATIERWQTQYVHVYAGWAAAVVLVFPPLFGYI